MPSWPLRTRALGWHLLSLSHVLPAHLDFTWIWISSESSLARPCSCPAVGSRALTTTLSPVRPLTRPCTVMAKLYCDGSWSDAWDRHQICFQGKPWSPSTPKGRSQTEPQTVLKGCCLPALVRPADHKCADCNHPGRAECPILSHRVHSWVNAENAGSTHRSQHFHAGLLRVFSVWRWL